MLGQIPEKHRTHSEFRNCSFSSMLGPALYVLLPSLPKCITAKVYELNNIGLDWSCSIVYMKCHVIVENLLL